MEKCLVEKKIASLWRISLLFSLLALTVSCKKTNNAGLGIGDAVVKVNLLGVEGGDLSSPSLQRASIDRTGGSGLSTGSLSQVVEVPFDDTYSLVARLTPVGSGASIQQAGANAKVAAVSGPAAAVAVREPLAQGVRYRLLIYDEAGNYVTEEDYTAGGPKPELRLDGGSSYTFVCYSIGSTSALPEVTNAQTLSDALFAGIDGSTDFMYYQGVLTLATGSNDLDIVLAHKFSAITVVVDASDVGNITAVSNTRITPHYSAISIQMSNGLITYQTAASNGSPVAFPEGTGTTKTSFATIVASPLTENGVLTIGSMTIAGTTRTNLSVSGLSIVPGQRYALNLTLAGGIVWAPSDLRQASSFWVILDGQESEGENFQKSQAYPFNDLITWPEDRDPCTRVNTGSYASYAWRTPSRSDFDRLIAGGYQAGSVNGVNGYWFPTQGNGVFLPFYGYRIHYDDGSDTGSWDHNAEGGSAGWYLFLNPDASEPTVLTFGANKDLAMISSSSNMGYKVRCIRDE